MSTAFAALGTDSNTPIDFYDVKQIQSILRIGRSSTYELIGRADFPKIRIGSTIRIPAAQFHDWVAAQLRNSQEES